MTENTRIVPFSLKDTPSLIEKVLPTQKLSIESYKEQMAGSGKTLTALGSYWKGRKPLILNKACILGALLPATENPAGDLEIFEMLMGMDDESFLNRWKRPAKPKEILETLSLQNITDYFTVSPDGILPNSGPIDWANPAYGKVKVSWRNDLSDKERRQIEIGLATHLPYRQRVSQAYRPEEKMETVHSHVWDKVNEHFGTSARSLPEIVEQLGIMRFGHRPRVADTFCGSGQIPFEAARLGCDTYASDLNPVACMLTWGAFHIVGGPPENRQQLERDQKTLIECVQAEVERLGVETDGRGWCAKVFLNCVEVCCPQTGWMVPLLPTRVVSMGHKVIAELVPDTVHQRYNIVIRSKVSDEELAAAQRGSVRSDGRGQYPYMIHTVGGTEYRTKISTLRGDFRKENGSVGNNLRFWEKSDFKPQAADIFQERLYCIQWMRPKRKRGPEFGHLRGDDYEFRSVTDEDIERERIVDNFIGKNLAEWQEKGWVPDMVIEPGDKTDEPIRTRGWTHWHHLFNPRQLLVAGLIRRDLQSLQTPSFANFLNYNSKLCRWDPNPGPGRVGKSQGVFDNQALNTLYNSACRSFGWSSEFFRSDYKQFPALTKKDVFALGAHEFESENDIYITDPPYGDAVKYEEILEFFISWLRKTPPTEFADWKWDSRRSLAIKGEKEDFRRDMVTAYKRMTELMPDNGIQIIMFTHQSGSIWSDMANIVWAAGLRVTAAWYVVTETDSALRGIDTHHVKGTVLLVLRKRLGDKRTSRDDLAMDIQDEVETQVQTLTGLNQEVRGQNRNENLFSDADLQMAGYAAALRVLTKYAIIDGKDMTAEALRPRVKGQTTFVDDLIEFAVETANSCLVPQGIEKSYWDKLQSSERFYLKMLDIESLGHKSLDNYQNFAKAFKVKDFKIFMASERANAARLKGSAEFGKTEMSGDSNFGNSTLRGVLYALMELQKDIDGDDVIKHLSYNVPEFYDQRNNIVEISNYLAKKLESIRPEEASAARVLRDLVRHQRA